MDKRRILAIDDDRSLWEAYQLILSPLHNNNYSREITALLCADSAGRQSQGQLNFDLDFAPQGRDGLALVDQALEEGRPYSVAFIDVRMPPGWDGVETASRIRAIDPNIEIVIVTAYSDRSREDLVSAAGGPEKIILLRKPFDPDELLQIALCLSEKWLTEKKEARQRLEMETILNTTPAAIFTLNEKWITTSWNPSAERITGYVAQDVLEQSCIFSRIAENRICSACREKNGNSKATLACPREMEIIDKAGGRKTIVLSSAPVNGFSATVSKEVKTFWDVTDRKIAEEALHDSESRFRALVETTSDLVWETDSEGMYTYCSPIVENIYGYKAEELKGSPIFNTLSNPEEADNFSEVFRSSTKRKTSFKGVERRSVKKSGQEIIIESSGTPIIGQNGQLLGFRGIDREVTERKKIEEEKLKLQEQQRISQRLDALGTMAGGIAHDLNNILTPILGYASICLSKISRDSKIYDEVQAIERAAAKAAELIRQILAFSRKQMLVPTTIDLNCLINDFSQVLHSLIREDIKLELDLHGDLWSTTGDSGQLEQILINLTVNAKDAIADGEQAEGGQITICTRNEFLSDGQLVDIEQMPIEGEFVVLNVSDNGVGMDPKTLDRILDPFFTTKEVGKGTGIGLSTVYGIVKQHEGHLRIESEKGLGTTFSVFLKRSKSDVAATVKTQPVSPAMGDETILLVEDNSDAREAICATLKNYGYSIIEACNGNDALAKYTAYKGKIDLLITDVVMPGLGGKGLAQKLRADNPKFPIVFMSGYAFGEIPPELIERRDASFIHKPFRPSELAAKVRQRLDNTNKTASQYD